MAWNWQRGCGIGCVVVALVGAVLAGGAVWMARQVAEDYKVVRAGEEALAEVHGSPADWAPESLVPASARVEAFLGIRRDLSEMQTLLTTHAVRLAAEDVEGNNPLRQLLDKVRAGNDLASLYAVYWTSRNKALADADMGAGEYIWLYHLVYHAWLGKDPAAGAGLGHWSGDDQGPEGVRAAAARERMRLMVGGMLDRCAPGPEEEQTWRDRELHRLEMDRDRIPWQTELPEPMRAAFAPYRGALEATWAPMVNPVELLFESEEPAVEE